MQAVCTGIVFSANAVSERTRQGITETQVEVTLLTEPNELHFEIMGIRQSHSAARKYI